MAELTAEAIAECVARHPNVDLSRLVDEIRADSAIFNPSAYLEYRARLLDYLSELPKPDPDPIPPPKGATLHVDRCTCEECWKRLDPRFIRG